MTATSVSVELTSKVAMWSVRLDIKVVSVYCRLLLSEVHMKLVTRKKENAQGGSGDVCCLQSDIKRGSNPKCW